MSQEILYTYFKNMGGNILLKYRKAGKSYAKKIDFYQPSLYMPCSEEESDARTLFDKPVKRKKFDNITEARTFTKKFADVDGIDWFGNSDFANQFLIELYKGETPVFDPKEIRVGILDIEVDTKTFPEPALAEKPINAITIYDSQTDTYYAMATSEYVREYRREKGLDEFEIMYTHDKEDPDVGALTVDYKEYADEESLIRAILTHFNEFSYDVTSGWNSANFDMVYIVKRCYQIVGEDYTKKMLSPFNRISFRESFNKKTGKEELKVEIVGLPHTDYQEMYKKHRLLPRESYRLDSIASEELNENKLDHEEEGSLYNLHRQNPQKFIVYNIKDVKLIKQLDEKLGYFALTATLSYYAGCNYEDTLGTVKLWEMLIAKELYNQNMVPLFSSPTVQKQDFEGGFVKEVLSGRWKWVIAFDYNSLYPKIEIQCNIGSETYVPRHELPKALQQYKSKYTLQDIIEKKADLSALYESGYSMTANFEFYRKDKVSVIAAIKDKVYEERRIYKKKMKAAESNKENIKAELERRGIKV